MTDRVTELFEQFVAERGAGSNTDPADWVTEAGDQGEALAGMIAAYLATHPRTDITEQEVFALAARPELEPPRPWPQLLPDLRQRTGTTRAELVRRLAELLGVKGSEPQVAGYVHELEAGLLAPTRVRPAVVSGLAAVLAVPQSLLEASKTLLTEPPMQAPLFARYAAVSASHVLAMAPDEPPPDPRVDDLFTGGGGG